MLSISRNSSIGEQMTLEEEIELYLLELEESSNPSFYPLFWDKHRFIVLKGGGGSGKSIFAGRKLIERCTTEAGNRFLVIRKVANTLRESCFFQLREQISNHYNPRDWTINKSEMSFVHRNGSMMITEGLDDVEKLKSIYGISGIWVEEASEIDERDLDQLNIRMRGVTKWYKQIILSFNPISITHWLKKRFFDRHSEDAIVHESTYKDNKFLDMEQIKVLEAFKETDPYYYTVYCLGGWGVVGATVFDSKKVAIQLSKISLPLRRGYYVYEDDGVKLNNIKWVDDSDGSIEIYKEPQKGYPYVIGGDTAGDGSDYFAGQVIDNVDGGQVARLRQKMDEDLYARQMFCLGKEYNNALIGLEANFSTHPIKELARLGYPNQYIRQKEDDYTGKLEPTYGFKTTSLTRPIIIGDLVRIVRESTELFKDRHTLEEMLTFVRNEKGRAEAQAGAHDDLIISLAIAYYIRTQQRNYVAINEGEKTEWRKDWYEDYRNASKEDKVLLIQMRGEPKAWLS